MANWKPSKSIVHWHMPGGEVLLETTTFVDTNPPVINTIAGFAARYAGGKIPERDGVRAHLWGQADENGILSAAMERAGKDKANPWGLSEDDFKNPVIVQDFGATEIGAEGLSKSEIMKQYPAPGQVGDWPVKSGDSTDPNRRTERKIMGPYGDFEKTVGGKTYYYKNTRLNRPSDPWYQSPTESRNMNPVVSSTMGQGSEVGGGQNPTGEKLSTGVKLIIANYSRDLPGEGEGGRYAAKLKNLVRELKSLVGMS